MPDRKFKELFFLREIFFNLNFFKNKSMFINDVVEDGTEKKKSNENRRLLSLNVAGWIYGRAKVWKSGKKKLLNFFFQFQTSGTITEPKRKG